MFRRIKELFSLNKSIDEKKQEIEKLNKEISLIKESKEEEIKKLDKEVNKEVNDLKSKKEDDVVSLTKKLKEIELEISKKDALVNEIEEYKKEIDKLSKKVSKENKRVESLKSIYMRLKYIVERYSDMNILNSEVIELASEEIDFEPTVSIKLKCMDIKELRKASNDNQKLIKELLKTYEGRYTTKANLAIYKLMVIALEAEQQNILYNLKYDKLDKSIDDIKKVTEKYLSIANTGNQSIVNTLVKFINEIEYLFIKSAEIEYEYYIKKEQQKQEQARLKEQMKQEAEERKILEQQKKQVEKEEEKYINEIQKVEEQLSATQDVDKIAQLNEKILELKNQLELVEEKKDEIVKRQNGKAGYVYVISNLGSFGEEVFKVGMTRRLDPMDRVKELGDASVPFEFDVHSFIFSEDAVGLEQKLHQILNSKRVNKINLRKEFFNVNIDELEIVVQDIDKSAEFNKTMIAEQYRQSLSIDKLEEVLI